MQRLYARVSTEEANEVASLARKERRRVHDQIGYIIAEWLEQHREVRQDADKSHLRLTTVDAAEGVSA